MDSLGEFLKEARGKLNISIEQITEDTRILRKFIEAIENDDFSAFPGETYLKGFLRNYSEYLGIDSDEVIRKYERIKMMETPTPIEQLIPKSEFNFKPFIIFGIIITIFFLSFIGYLLFKNIAINRIILKNNQLEEGKNIKDKVKFQNNLFVIKEENEKKIDNLKKGDILEIGEKKYKILIKELSPIVILNYGDNKELILIQSYQHKVDLNDDGNIDVLITLNNWDDNFASISFKLNMSSIENFISDSNSIGENPEVIFSVDNIEDFDISFKVNMDTYFRYKVDDAEEVEKYYVTGSVVNVKIKNKVIIWLTNSSSVSLFFKNKEFSLGESGKVLVKMLLFRKNYNNKYDLILSDLR